LIGQLVAAAAALYTARYLGPTEYGAFALGTALGMFTLGVGNTGPSQWLVSRRLVDDRQASGEAAKLAVAINGSGAAVAAVLVPVLLIVGGRGGAALTLGCIALATLMTTGWPLQLASLQHAENFAAISSARLVSRVVRSVATLGLAVAGAGVAALAIPIVLAAGVQALLGHRLAERFPRDRVRFRGIRPENARTVSWIAAAGLLGTVVAQADYAALALVTTVPTLGIYYFAYQIAAQFATIATSVADSLFVTDARRGSDNFRPAIVATTTATTAVLVTIALSAEWLERKLWAGTWSEAVATIQIVCLILPLRLLMPLLRTSRMLAGQERRWSAEASLVGASTFIAAIATGLATDTIEVVAGITLSMSSLTVLGLLATIDRRAAVQSAAVFAAIAVPASVSLTT